MLAFPADPAAKQQHALTLLHGAMTLEGLRIAWKQVWHAYDDNPPDACTRAKNARNAQLELQMGMK